MIVRIKIPRFPYAFFTISMRTNECSVLCTFYPMYDLYALFPGKYYVHSIVEMLIRFNVQVIKRLQCSIATQLNTGCFSGHERPVQVTKEQTSLSRSVFKCNLLALDSSNDDTCGILRDNFIIM